MTQIMYINYIYTYKCMNMQAIFFLYSPVDKLIKLVQSHAIWENNLRFFRKFSCKMYKKYGYY